MSASRLAWLLPLFCLAACSSNHSFLSTNAESSLHGLVRGGQQPVTGATVQLYAVGTTGDGSTATPLLNPAPQTDSSGSFNITGTYICPSPGSLMYILATGGNPGLASGTNNPAIALVATLGACGNLTASTQINIDEVTTVAAVNALAPFAASPTSIGSSPSDSASLSAAFALATEFANTTTGTSPGVGITGGTAIPNTKINMLADILAPCINSLGGVSGDSSSCGNLFALTTPTGITAATDTFTAALHLAWAPTLNTTGLFNLATPSAPFQPILTSMPVDFSVEPVVSSGLSASLASVSFAATESGAISASQSVTLTNNSSASIVISGFSFNGFDSAEFSQTNNCPSTLSAQASCTLQIAFAPSSAGLRVAQLSIANNTAASPLVIGLSGTGSAVTAPQLLSASPASAAIGTSTTITLTGSGFTQSSVVYLSGLAQTTTYISPQSVSFTLGTQYTSFLTTLPIAVRNAGFSSSVLQFAIVYAVPTLASISPSTVIAGSSNFALTVNGTGISSSSTVVVNGLSHTVSANSSASGTVFIAASEVAAVGNLAVTLVNPTPGGGSSAVQQLNVTGADNRLRTMNYATSDIVTDPVRPLLYASVNSSSSNSPNSLISINPLTGTVVTTQTLSAQPGRLAISTDGSYVYVGQGTSISRLILPALTPDISWTLPYTVEDIEVAPGLPHTVAVTVEGPNFTGNLAIYDDGVARPLAPQGSYAVKSFDTVAWANNATVLYGTDANFSGGPEYIFSVNASGATLSSTNSGGFGEFLKSINYNSTTGLLYDGYGNAVTPGSGALAGQFPVQAFISYEPNPFAIDSVHGRAFYLVGDDMNSNGNSYSDIQAFDLTHYAYIGTLAINNLAGSKIVPWGASGLAVAGGSQIFLVDGSFVSPAGVTSPVGGYAAETPSLTSISPQSVQAGSGSTTVTLTGANFNQAETVIWNGQTIPSTWQSSTLILATLPASLLTQAASLPFYVNNGPTTENSNGIAFAVLPDFGPNTQITAIDVSGEDMVWDDTHSLLYVAVTNPVAPNGNSIVVVDPAAGQVETVIYTGYQPAVLGISGDNQYLYTGFQTLATINRFTLPNFALNLTIPLNSGLPGENFAADIKVAPGQPQTIAVSMGNKSIEPRDAGGLAIFDNAVERPATLARSFADTNKVTWGADATHLYANSDPELTPQSFSALAVNSTGITGFIPAATGLAGIGLRPHYDPVTNLIYTDGGGIANPADGSANGFFEFGALMVPDPVLNRAFIVHENSPTSYQLDIYNLTRQTFLKTLPLPALIGNPTQLVRWGSQGLALLTDSQGTGAGMLYILQGSDISGLTTPPAGEISLNPSSVIAGSATVATITVNGTGFTSASTVLVNGATRATTFVNATQLSFQLTAADQAVANYLTVEVESASSGGTTSPATSLGVLNSAPGIAALSPAKVLQNAGSINVTLNGTGFIPGTVVSFAGSARTTTYVSPTQVSVAITSTDIGTAGYFAITATNGGPGGGTSPVATLESDNPVPVLSSNSPLFAAGSGPRTLAITGSNLVTGTVLMINGSPRPTTYVFSSEVTVQLTAADLASAGTLTVTAVNPAPGGGTSGVGTINVSSGFPGPLTFSPSSTVQGTATPTTITVNGSNFTPSSYVYLNGPRATTYISSTQLTFVLTVADQANATTLLVFVENPGTTTGGSSEAPLPVTAAASTPTISSLSPTSFVAGSGSNYLLVYGTGFTASSQVLWNGSMLTGTFYESSGLLETTIPASLLASTGTASVTVNNPTATTPLSNAVQVSIVNPPAPTLTTISPTNGPINTAFTATLNGTGFTANSVVSINGIAVTTTFVAATQLTAAVPAAQVVPGNELFTVTTPAPGGGTTSAATYTAYIPIVNNSMVFNPVSQLFYLSIPSSAGEPYGNSVVSLDPLTGALGTPIPVGSEPNLMALSSDGTTLWVALDGSNAVRQVNLTTQAAGLQFALPSSTSYTSPLKVSAIASLPGQPNSVAVAAGNQYINASLGLYDSGVPRGNVLILLSGGFVALQINGSSGEIYAANGGGFSIYTYNSSGLTLKTSNLAVGSLFAPYQENQIQLLNGSLYDDYSTVVNSETGALLGTLGTTPTNTGAILAIDSSQKVAFQLNTPVQYSQLPTQIQTFNLTTFAAGSSVIPVNIASTAYGPVATPYRLTRWGANGLAFRTNVGVYALRSNLVKDLSATPADLSVTLTSSGSSIAGSQTTYTATVANAGPSAGTEVALIALIPATGVLVSATPSAGFCSSGASVTCNLGSIASGAQATVTLLISQISTGSASMTVQVSASEADPNLADNQATSTNNIGGSTYYPAPVIGSISPSTVLAGSTDRLITVAGIGFGAGSTVLLDGAPLPTSVVSATQATATVPAASLSTLGWHAISVSNPSPGGGVSAVIPLSIFSAIKAGASHIIYEPFSRTILATITSAMPLGNSVGTLTPATGTFNTPVAIGSEPTRMALSDDGQVLYVYDSGSSEIVRYNLMTQQIEGSIVALGSSFAVQPGTESTVAIPQNQQSAALVDFNPTAHTAIARPNTTENGAGGYMQFLNASTLLVSGGNLNEEFARYTVSASGLSSTPSSYVTTDFGPFRIANGTAFTANGGVVDVTDQPERELGVFTIANISNLEAAVAPDPTLGRAFYLAGFNGTNYSGVGLSGIAAFATTTYTADAFLPLNIAAIDGNPSPALTAMDVVRWGQDGLAALTSAGTIYLIRGPAVVPQLLQTSSAPVLSTSSPTALQHGSGNTTITVAGSNFLPGVAATWNGSYRTTILVDAGHITVDIPASDLLSAGSAAVAAANPGSATSTVITVNIN